MNVILLQKIHKLGELGETVRVKAGFGRNYLFPTGKAVPATPDNLEKFEQRRAELEGQQVKAEADARNRAAAIEGTVLVIVAKAGPEGKLYGSVGPADIADVLTAMGKPVEKREVRLPTGPLRMIGEHKAAVHMYADVSVEITVQVKAADAASAAG